MQEAWNNGIRMVNGRVKPPIVLRSETEIFIAQNAHNLIWDNHWEECTALDKEIEAAEKMQTDPSSAKERLQAVFTVVKGEIEERIITEIHAYRKERMASIPSFDIEERLEQIEKKFKEMQEELDEVREIAEDAQNTADDAQCTAEDAQEMVESLQEKWDGQEEED